MDGAYSGDITFFPASDQSLLLQFGDRITPEAGELVTKLVRTLEGQPIPGVRDFNPAYCSLLVKFDALQIRHVDLEAQLRSLLDRLHDVILATPREVEIPVFYGGEFGPDLDDVATLHQISGAEAIRLHSEAVYTVCF